MQAKQPRISNGCEYIAVINFAKKKNRKRDELRVCSVGQFRVGVA